jgi:alpha-beta hydrolase superfamily lysophospholipase
MHRCRLVALLIAPLLTWALAIDIATGQAPPTKGKTPIVRPGVQPPPKGAPGFQPKAPFQPKANPTPAAAMPATARPPKLPEPEEVSLETKDGMTIKATYYPALAKKVDPGAAKKDDAGSAKKESSAVIMIHGLEGQRGEYHNLAVFLQGLGYASIAPDLRGHGQSKVQKRSDGTAITLEPEKLTKPSLEDMIYDIQACKKFLLEKNNAGELNIEQLCVIGAELGAILAVQFAAYDWSVQDLPAYKQGKDVKALVLLSPPPSVKGMTLRSAMAFPPVQSRLSIMFVAGKKDTKATSETKKLYNALEAHHPKAAEDKDDRLKAQELFLIQPETNLSGTELLTKASSVPRDIAQFLDLRLAGRSKEFPWQDRTNPLDN